MVANVMAIRNLGSIVELPRNSNKVAHIPGLATRDLSIGGSFRYRDNVIAVVVAIYSLGSIVQLPRYVSSTERSEQCCSQNHSRSSSNIMPSKRSRSEFTASQAHPEYYDESVLPVEEELLSLEQEVELAVKEFRGRTLESINADNAELEELERKVRKIETDKIIVEDRKDRFLERFVKLFADATGRTITKDRVALGMTWGDDFDFVPPQMDIGVDVLISFPELVFIVDNNDDEFDAYLEAMNAADYDESSYYDEYADYDTDCELEELYDYTPAYKRPRK